MEELYSKMKFTLVYNDNTVTISVNREKYISYLRSQAYLLYDLKGRFSLYYKNRDLTPFLDTPIKTFFKNLRHVHILIKNSMKSFSNDLNRSLPQINQKFYSPENLIQSKRAMTKCFECKNEKINFFCRDCGIFLCRNCRMKNSLNHYSHRTVTLYPEDLNKSAMLYKEVVNGDLYDAKYSRMQMGVEELEEPIDISLLMDQTSKKLKEMFELIEKIRGLNINISEVQEGKESQIQILEQVIDDVKKDEDKNNDSNIIERFSEINKKEKEYDDLLQIKDNIEKWRKTNRVCEMLLKKVERKIYNVLCNALNEKIDDTDYKSLQNYMNFFYGKNNHNAINKKMLKGFYNNQNNLNFSN